MSAAVLVSPFPKGARNLPSIWLTLVLVVFDSTLGNNAILVEPNAVLEKIRLTLGPSCFATRDSRVDQFLPGVLHDAGRHLAERFHVALVLSKTTTRCLVLGNVIQKRYIPWEDPAVP